MVWSLWGNFRGKRQKRTAKSQSKYCASYTRYSTRKGGRTHKTAAVQDMPAQVLLWCTVCLELEAPEGQQGQRELSLNPLICQNTELP